uniref:Vacuolar protein-sorting-associated protein 25 n=2 Tax=Lygus hesperus TaxID=30085 RepID=A0A0A9YDT6_LYGHE
MEEHTIFTQFPPFYTLQQHPATREKQLSLWKSVVLSYCSERHVTKILLETAPEMDLFYNSQIQRGLARQDISAVLEYIQSQGYGLYSTEDKSVFVITPLQITQIADDIYTWASNFGLLNNVSTLAEICMGEETCRETFHALPEMIIESALRCLESSHRVALFPGTTLHELGVKFLA